MTNGHRQPCVSGATLQGGNETRFPPIAGPFSSPHTGVLPTAWQSFESDLNSPDISSWLPHQISNYFVQQGFGNDVCKVFIEQVWNKSKKIPFYQKSLFCVFIKLLPILSELIFGLVVSKLGSRLKDNEFESQLIQNTRGQSHAQGSIPAHNSGSFF